MLRITDLHVGYDGRRVLQGVDLEVGQGEIVGLVGPNGCGKTTLLHAVTRVIPWQAGEVWLLGRPAAGLTRRRLARLVATVPQQALLPAGYTVLDVVLMGRSPYLGFLEQEGPEDVRRAKDALRRVGAESLEERRVDELSGGERQAVILARALAQATPILLLDEPASGLDIGHQVTLFRLLREMARREGPAVLIAIHDLTLASLYCDRLALLAAGRILARGSPREVLTRANIARAYGAEPLILAPEALPGPVVLPYEG